MSNTSLDDEIKELVELPVEPKSEWLARFEAASDSAVKGAILHWANRGGGIIGSGGGDGHIHKRETAVAILNARLSSRVIFTMEKLDRSAGRLALVGLVLSLIGVVFAGIQLWNT